MQSGYSADRGTMSEENRDDAGQFAPSTEGAVGEDYLNRAAGYVPFEEAKPAESDDSALDLADKFAEARGAPESEIRTYSETFENLPDNASLTSQQLGELFAEHRESGEKQIEAAEIEATRKEIDEERGVKPEEAAAEAATVTDVTVEPESEDAALEKLWQVPKVKAALTEVNDRFTHAVNTANNFALASLGDYPEIMALPPEQREGALVAMAQREPERFDKFMASLNRVAQLQAAQQQQQQQAEQRRQAELSEYAKAESLKFEESIKDVPKAERAAIEANIAEAIMEYGADINEFVKLMQSSEFASATAQRLLWDVGKYRQIMKAKVVAAAKPPPAVQRPGVAGPRLTGAAAEVASAKASLDGSTKSLGNFISALRRAG
jgi:hypothetical protein